MVKIKRLIAFLISFCVAFPTTFAYAGGCGAFFHHKQVAVAAVPVLVTHSYQVSPDLEIEAALERILRRRESQNQTKQQNTNQQNQEVKQNQLSSGNSFKQVAPKVYEKCARCHENDNSSAGEFFSFSNLNGDSFLRITDMVANKTDVPDEMISVINSFKQDEYGPFLDQMIKLTKATLNGNISSNKSVNSY